MRTISQPIQGNPLFKYGGAIDNTASNSASDATREWAEEAEMSKSEVILDQRREKTREQGLRGYLGSSGKGILERMYGGLQI